MTKSTHICPVVTIKMEPHPNADRLAVVRVDDYTVCVAKDMWTDGQKGVYIPIESIVDTDMEEFAFLNKGKRFQKVKTSKLRGVYSQGVLIPAPEDATLGEDMAAYFKVVHDDPEAKFEGKTAEIPGPKSWPDIPKYDIDALLKHGRTWFVEDEPVIVTEKIHGTNFRCLYDKDTDQFYVGSRRQWLALNEKCMYWRILYSCPQLREFCKANPIMMFRGEGYGMQGGYAYGLNKGRPQVACFDIMYKDRTYLSHNDLVEVCLTYDLPMVPIIGKYAYNLDTIKELAEGVSALDGKTNKEGVVVKPLIERRSEILDRIILKLIGSGYKG